MNSIAVYPSIDRWQTETLGVCLSVCLSSSFICSIYLSNVCSIVLSVCLSIYHSVFLSIYHSVFLSIYHSVFLSISVCLSVCLSVYSIYHSLVNSIYLSIVPSIDLSVCLHFGTIFTFTHKVLVNFTNNYKETSVTLKHVLNSSWLCVYA